MSLQDLVKVTITKQTASVSRRGFGTPLIMSTEAGEDNKFTGTAKIYTALDQLGSTGDNYDTSGVTYLKAQSIFAQNPKVDQIVIGKRSLAPLMKVDLTPIAKNSTLYRVTVFSTDFDYTSDATATVAEITAGLTAAMSQTAWAATTAYSVGDYVSNGGDVYICTTAGTSAASGGPSGEGSSITDGTVVWAFKGDAVNITPTDNTTDLSVEKADTPGGTATAGTPFTIEYDRSLLTGQNTTADPGVVTDLNLIRNNTDGNDDWYAVILDSYGKSEISALSAAIETISRIYLASTSDADILTASTTDIASDLLGLSVTRTALVWHEDPHSGPEAAWAGKALPSDPGSITWKFKTLALISPSSVTPSEEIELKGKNANRYLTVAGRSIMCDGKMAGGEFIDITRGIDFITARLEENIFLQLANLPKIPFTDPGIAIIENEVRGVLELGVSQGIFASDPPFTVTVPLAADVDQVDKANRLLPDVDFSATLAGAIHAVEVNGTVTL